MLQDMVEKIELEGKQDEEIIKKFDCWYKKQEQELKKIWVKIIIFQIFQRNKHIFSMNS